MKRALIVWLVVACVALPADLAAGHALAQRDVLAQLLIHFEPRLLALLIVLFATHLYLLLLAPGWLLFIVIRRFVAKIPS